MEKLCRAVSAVSDAVWGPWTIALLLGTGLFLTPRFRFVQLTRLRPAKSGLVPRGGRAGRGDRRRAAGGE